MQVISETDVIENGYVFDKRVTITHPVAGEVEVYIRDCYMTTVRARVLSSTNTMTDEEQNAIIQFAFEECISE